MPFKWRMKYMCFYCGHDIDNYEDLKKHTKSHGPCSDRDRAVRLVKSPDCEVKIDVSDVTCKLCLESFIDFDDIVSHLIFEHRLPYNKKIELSIATYRLFDLKCLWCGEMFRYFRHLVRHMNRFHPSNCFPCDECDLTFNKKRDLRHHLRVLHRDEYTCPKCPERFSTNTELRHHRLNAHVSTCNVCFKSFSSVKMRLLHMKLDHDPNSKCGICDKTMTTRQGFLRHASQCPGKGELEPRNDIVIEVVDDEDKNQSVKMIRSDIALIFNMSTAMPFKFFQNKFRCFYCTNDFQNCADLKEHTISVHPLCDVSLKAMKMRNRNEGLQIKVDTSALSCKSCLVTLDDMDDLYEHLDSEHKLQVDQSVRNYLQSYKLIDSRYSCPFCGEMHRYFGLLLKHVSRNHTDNKYLCTFCGKSFRTNPNLRAHVVCWHKNVGRYKCNYCELTFTTNYNLKLHLGRAHGCKVIQCAQCPDTFATNYDMQRHMLARHGAGHRCVHCGRVYVKHSTMINHIRRLHLKEKNVQCAICSERFFDAQRLKTHMVKHVGERNFQCDICGKKFLWKKNLRGHMDLHLRSSREQD